MNKFKKMLRMVCLVILILLACMGAGFMLPNRGRFMDNEIKIELVEKKDDETDEMELKNIKE